MAYVFSRAASLEGQKKVGSTQCVALIQLFAGAPNHRAWKQGAPVLGNDNIAPGTAIATFVDGRYPNNPTGNHAALFLRHGVNGFWVMDQWKDSRPEPYNKKPTISSRFVRSMHLKQNPQGAWPQANNNADAYFVIE